MILYEILPNAFVGNCQYIYTFLLFLSNIFFVHDTSIYGGLYFVSDGGYFIFDEYFVILITFDNGLVSSPSLYIPIL